MFAEEKLQANMALCNNFSQAYGSGISGTISSLYGSHLEARADTVGRAEPFVVLQIVDANDKVLPLGNCPRAVAGYCAGNLLGNTALQGTS